MTSNTRRIQFDLNAERLRELDRIMGQCDFTTRKDLVNTAISFFEWAVSETSKGRSIGSFNEETKNIDIIRMLPLENAARKLKTHVRTVSGKEKTSSVKEQPHKRAVEA